MYNNHETLAQKILKQEFDEVNSILKKQVGDTVKKTYAAAPMERGHVLYPVSANKKSVADLIATGGEVSDNTNRYCSNTFIDSIRDNIVTFDKQYTYWEALPVIQSFIEKAGDHFYGAVLRSSSNELINPLHPMTALAVLNDTTRVSTKYKLFLYFYTSRPAMDKAYDSASSDPDKISATITNLLRSFSTEAISVGECTKVIENREANSFQLEFQQRLSADAPLSAYASTTVAAQYYMVASQVLTRGVFIPYYGAGIIRKQSSGNGEGMAITPCLPVNIGFSRGAFNSICTGSQPRNTLEGIRVLNHSNLSSPMNRDSIQSGILPYVDACINASLALYFRAGKLESETTIKPYVAPKKTIDPAYLSATTESELVKLATTNGLTPQEIMQLIKDIDDYRKKHPTETFCEA